jgi:hypothetical protein
LIFDDWFSHLIVPGIAHPAFKEIHPDIKESCNTISKSWIKEGVKCITKLSDKRLASVRSNNSLLLIGGPISNMLAREWQGFRRNPKTKIIEFTNSFSIKRRWRFQYRFEDNPKNKIIRYVNKSPHRSMPQAIKDEKTNEYRWPRGDKEGFLHFDWLIISFVKSVWDKTGRANIIDVSDLHGQGNKAFSDLMNSYEQLSALFYCLDKNGLRGQHFQALYKIIVEHVENVSRVRDYQLIDVAPI